MTAIFLLTLCPGADRVTVDFNALPAKEAAVRLSEATGLDLRIEPRLANEVVMVVAKEVPREELMGKVAQVLHARWEVDSRGWILRRPSETQRTLEREAMERRVARFTALWERNREFLKSVPPPDARAAEIVSSLRTMVEMERTGKIEIQNGVYEPKYLTGAKVLLRQAMDRIGPRELASLKGDVVYAQNPTAAQRRLDLRPYLEEYRQTQERLATEPREIDGLSAYISGLVFDPVRRPRAVGKALVSFFIQGGTMWGIAKVYGTDGKKLDAADFREQFDEGVALSGRTERPSLKRVLATPGRKAPLSPLSTAIAAEAPGDPDAYLVSYNIPEKGLSDEARTAILEPDRQEPLGLAASDALRGLAEGRAIVACLPDSCVRYAQIASSGTEVQLGVFEASARDLGDVQFAREGDWLRVQPRDPIRDEGLRLPRAALGEMLRAGYRNHGIGVREYAIYKHRADGRDGASSIDHLYTKIAGQVGAGLPFAYFQLPGGLWRLLGTLPEAHWNGLIEGKTIAIGRLPDSIRRVPEWARSVGERTPDAEGAQVSDQMLEVTECMPLGVSGGVTLRLGGSSQDVFQRVEPRPLGNDDPLWDSRALPLSDLAVLSSEYAETDKIPDPTTLFRGKYRVGSQRTFQFILHIARGVQVSNQLPLRPEMEKGEGLSWAELPESHRNALKRHLQDLAKRRAAERGDGTIQ